MPKPKGIPKGYNTITTYLAVKGADKVIVFAKKAFGAKLLFKHLHDDGRIMHAEVMVGDTRLMLGDPGDSTAIPAMLYMFVPNCDVVYKKAIKAGGKSIMKPADQFYGDRSSAVRDVVGNTWWISTRKETVSKKEIKKRSAKLKASK